MEDAVNTAADSALAELLEVSPQVDAAIVVERAGGAVLASAPVSSGRTPTRFGSVCTKILAAAERSRTELGREPVSQIEVATSDGHVFVVADATCIVAAVTDADPTVGLVFYDLKTALRSIREARADGTIALASGGTISTEGSTFKQTAPKLHSLSPDRTSADEASGDDGSDEAADGDAGTSDESEAASRWRRRKR